MLDFYRTPAGKRLIDETLPEIALQLKNIAQAIINMRVENPDSGNDRPTIQIPGDSLMSGIECNPLGRDPENENKILVQLNPDHVHARFPDREDRQELFQDPWGGYVWFNPAGYYYSVSPGNLSGN